MSELPMETPEIAGIRVSVIVVAYNGLANLRHLKKSLYLQIGPEDEQIIFDNAS